MENLWYFAADFINGGSEKGIVYASSEDEARSKITAMCEEVGIGFCIYMLHNVLTHSSYQKEFDIVLF